mmetsp:Transcript_21333/g.33172  ORF Transcript_21333/g.33172 Transcript_21333/m.33172 type:complete len:177 (-) Transcript_21333:26-556(-)
MVHPDSHKYKIPDRTKHLPHFTDFNDARFAHASDSGHVQMQGYHLYNQWLHCVGNWGEEHSMCKKARWYVVKNSHPKVIKPLDQKKNMGMFDRTLLYGLDPYPGFVPTYQPVKKNRPGAYEWALARDFEPLHDVEAANYIEKAPILHDIFVKGKKPIWDSKEDAAEEGEDNEEDTE